jgi:hypothetical protein
VSHGRARFYADKVLVWLQLFAHWRNGWADEAFNIYRSEIACPRIFEK